ncbi:MAG: radical SAM protein [Halobacteriovorax sp.]|nr:radical SAM protein [Halobacteriovorax sp.]|tara:strand:- start:361 stop:1305 length:945 start_codon:yes stop_codon:yes gene_type:complete
MNFKTRLTQNKIQTTRKSIDTLQINVGKLCNQACRHCHVEAGPTRTENMEREGFDRLLHLIDQSSISMLDLTGGAPEMNPNFRWFVSEVRKRNITVLDRCNLTVMYEPGQADLAQFLADHKVQIVASLPCYSQDNVDKQRGNGVFDKSIRALRQLNQLGYGKGQGLQLDLVYNPTGPTLPPAQDKLQSDYKKNLKEWFDIDFDNLYTITNMPIKRFLDDLNRQGKYEEYLETLVNAFNPNAAANMMCFNLVSIGYDGQIYDCDFNQMLDLNSVKKPTIWTIENFDQLINNEIVWGEHCHGCSAGAGSSCGGSLT